MCVHMLYIYVVLMYVSWLHVYVIGGDCLAQPEYIQEEALGHMGA